jgi:hypothetical protein
MIGSSRPDGTPVAPVLWLATTEHPRVPPPRARGTDRAVRSALFERLATQGHAPTGGAHLSHAGGYAGYLCGATPSVGIDLEWIRPRDVLALAKFAYAAEEARCIEALPDADRGAAFINLWVLKEAAAKVLDLDLLTALARCRFVIQGAHIEGQLPRAGNWTAWLYAPNPSLRLAVLSFGDDAEPEHVEWPVGAADAAIVHWPTVATTAR